MPSRHLALALAVLVVAVSACSFSDSSGSISKSVSSPFKSSSDSSGNSQAAYREDVRDYTASYVRSGGDFDAFERKIGSVAAKHGITDWELDNNTYLAI
ncbi:MAG TPA: putative lipoprotein, partial [Myxococcota bacterium]|nr:putative lipoprotein [Myxococcota bacterium]